MPKEGQILVVFDGVEAIGRLSDMQNNIREFAHTDIHDELLDWQTEDMHRKYPNIDSDQEYVSWFTLIWPRSRTYDLSHHAEAVKRFSRRRRRRMRPLAAMPRLPRGAKRPILREALFNRLVQRMSELLGERLSWARSSTGGPPSDAAADARRQMLGPSNLNL